MSEAVDNQEVVEDNVESINPESVENEETQEVVETSEESVEEVQADTTEELQEEIADAIDEGATEEEVKDMIRKFQLKVNGKTIEKEIDLNDEDSLKRELQKAAAFQTTAQEAAELKKMYEQEIRRLQSNPWEVLQELGLDPDELNEKFLDDRINEMKKTPEQVEKENMEKELSAARERLKEIERLEQERVEQEKMAQADAELQEEIIAALDAHKTLPPTQKTMSRIADALIYAMDYAEENGFDPNSVSVADVIPHVETEYRQEMRTLLDNAPEQLLEEYVGKQNLERLRKSRVAAAKEAQKNTKTDIKSTAKSLKTEEKTKEKMRSSDFFRNLHKMVD